MYILYLESCNIYNASMLKTTISTINCVKEISIELCINYKLIITHICLTFPSKINIRL